MITARFLVYARGVLVLSHAPFQGETSALALRAQPAMVRASHHQPLGRSTLAGCQEATHVPASFQEPRTMHASVWYRTCPALYTFSAVARSTVGTVTTGPAATGTGPLDSLVPRQSSIDG